MEDIESIKKEVELIHKDVLFVKEQITEVLRLTRSMIVFKQLEYTGIHSQDLASCSLLDDILSNKMLEVCGKACSETQAKPKI